jgi:hypothetical protein
MVVEVVLVVEGVLVVEVVLVVEGVLVVEVVACIVIALSEPPHITRIKRIIVYFLTN